MIKKADIVLALVIVIAGISGSFALASGNNSKVGDVIIHNDNQLYGTYSLLEDKTITIEEKDHINKVTINKGEVTMIFSNCSSQNCVKQGTIQNPSQSIICLPHKIVVEVTGIDSDFDGISK